MANGLNTRAGPAKAVKGSADTRIGGKGTPRRKHQVRRRTNNVAQDNKLVGVMKRLRCDPIPGMEEINIFFKDGSVLHFDQPRLNASVQCNMYVVTGRPEKTTLGALFSQSPQIIKQMGPEELGALASSMPQGGAAEADDVPDLVADTNFGEQS